MFSIDQLVCEYYNCTGGDHCVRGYEVCDENPSWIGDTCIAVLERNDSELEVVYQSCFIRNVGTYHENCILREQPANVYSCLCSNTLCNSVDASLIAPTNRTQTSPYRPTGNYDNSVLIIVVSICTQQTYILIPTQVLFFSGYFRMYSCV